MDHACLDCYSFLDQQLVLRVLEEDDANVCIFVSINNLKFFMFFCEKIHFINKLTNLVLIHRTNK